MIVVTGGLGFVGKNLVQQLNFTTKQQVTIVDKFKKLNHTQLIISYIKFENYKDQKS